MPFTKRDIEELSSNGSEPAWLRELRLEAWQRYEATPMPDSSKDEDWRRTDISKLDLDTFGPSRNGSGAATLTIQPAEQGSSTQADGAATSVEGAPPPGLPHKVVFCALDEAVQRCPDLVRPHLSTGTDKFSSLNAAQWSHGAFVYVPAGAQVETPLHAEYPEDADATFPRTVIILERGACLTFVDHFAPQGKGASASGRFSSAFTTISVAEGARLQYVSLQERGRRTWHFSRESASVARDAKVDFVLAALGGSTCKSYVDAVLTGPGAEANLVGLVLTDGDQHVDHQTLQDHLAPHTTSNLLLKSAVKGHSQSIFAGLVHMPQEAQQSDAFQEARALLLSEHAKADAIPKLEIVANDVRCTHAGAIGQVDAEQKFYLMSRGIPERETERLIVGGFFEPALERIPVASVRDNTRKALLRRLEALDG